MVHLGGESSNILDVDIFDILSDWNNVIKAEDIELNVLPEPAQKPRLRGPSP